MDTRIACERRCSARGQYDKRHDRTNKKTQLPHRVTSLISVTLTNKFRIVCLRRQGRAAHDPTNLRLSTRGAASIIDAPPYAPMSPSWVIKSRTSKYVRNEENFPSAVCSAPTKSTFRRRPVGGMAPAG